VRRLRGAPQPLTARRFAVGPGAGRLARLAGLTGASCPHGARPLLLAVALAACAGAALAAEDTVTCEVDGLQVVGTLNLPDGVATPPAVLPLHGFTGTRDEPGIPAADNEGIFRRAARTWAEQGLASLRIDDRVTGEAEGDFADPSLDAHVAGSLAAVDWPVASGRVDAKRIGVVGWSMGCAIGPAVAARSEHDIAALALWAPATNLAASLLQMSGAEKFNEGLKAGDSPSASPCRGAPRSG
jgi:dipeptidyl aminopeptidase/acylaminoacyl peptidase